jgi:CDGSH-type Zn-finger protein
MADVKIQALDNGPYMITGKVDILDGVGKSMETKEECFLCRCGKSDNQPFCTGAHQGSFKNEVRK